MKPPWRTPLAYQLSAELLSSLIRGNPPNTEDHLETLANHNLYLDLPGRGLPITDEQSIRAIFVQPTRIPWHWMVVCVLTAGHANAMTGRYAWIIDKDGELTDQVGLSIEADLPPESINRVVMRIIKLAILYAMTHDNRAYLPSISAEALQRLKPKKQRARQKTHSLFSVRKLERQPSDRLPTGQRDGWTLAHVVEVSEHFRWQAHGPGRKLRKLIWIEAYERGVGEKKPSLTRL